MRQLTLHGTDAFDSVTLLHMVELKGHKDATGGIVLSRGVHLGVGMLEL